MSHVPKLIVLTLLLAACGGSPAAPAATQPPTATSVPVATQPPTATSVPAATPTSAPTPAEPVALTIRSDAFADGGAIPTEHTCDGANSSPALTWGAPPPGAASLALIMEDLDYDRYTHWVLFNIPPDARGLPAGVAAGEQVAGVGLHAQNAFAQPGYNGPCPDPGDTHTYTFTLYALSASLPLAPEPSSPVSKGMVREAMEGLVLGEGLLTGRYTRP